jgi:hypothetical protein
MFDWEDLVLFLYAIGVIVSITNGHSSLVILGIMVGFPCALLSIYLKP